MVVKIHFETLSPGLQAKLDARYRANTNHIRIEKNNGSKRVVRNSPLTRWLADAIKMPLNRLQ